MIFEHWSDALWDDERWPDFPAHEFACNHCGELYYDPEFFDITQALRTLIGRPVSLSSAHRCVFWNAHEGGAPMSEHKKVAADVRLSGHDPARLFKKALVAGFTTFGFYQSFVHMDLRPGRRWCGSNIARQKWKSYLASEPQLLAAASLV